jgi:hypothetical protein
MIWTSMIKLVQHLIEKSIKYLLLHFVLIVDNKEDFRLEMKESCIKENVT